MLQYMTSFCRHEPLVFGGNDVLSTFYVIEVHFNARHNAKSTLNVNKRVYFYFVTSVTICLNMT